MQSPQGNFGFTYDALSRRTQLTRPNGVNTNYTYDSLSRLLSVLHQTGSTTIDGATYTYDNAGNRLTKLNHLNGITETYGYDSIYQLLSVLQGATTTESYTYDKVGNRLTSLGGIAYTVNNANQVTTISGSPGTAISYDNNGNMTTKLDASGTTTYTWNSENQLKQVILPGGTTVAFTYDPFERRVQKVSPSGSINYLYDGANIIQELDSSGAVVATYAHGQGMDHVLTMARGTTSYYEADGIGSVTSLTDVAGAVANTYAYESFGKQSASSGPLVNASRYTRREFDSDIGLYYYRARYYDQNEGRFISEDPIHFGGGINFYAYADNNPATYNDPTGTGGFVDAILDRISPVAGAPSPPRPLKPPPIYYPGGWNDDSYLNTNNCYSYACDRRHPPGPQHAPQPGEDSGMPRPQVSCEVVRAFANLDGLLNAQGGACPCNYHKVQLFVGNHIHRPGRYDEDFGPDYHWYRLDSNGKWSSKHGFMPVGPQVVDPVQDAQSWGYYQNCGFLCAINR